MDDAASPGESASARPFWARLGIVALNLPAPGLGLLRLGRAREALLFFCVPWIVWLAVLASWSIAPPLGFWPLASCYALLLLAAGGATIGSAWRSWRLGAERPARIRPSWSRWYVILAAAILAYGASRLVTPVSHYFYQPFYMPSEGMTPTLVTNDRILASMRGPGLLKRGEVILFRTPDGVYLKRLAALPGDTIGMVDGVVVLNGARVPQQLERVETYHAYSGDRKVRRLREHFPGETGSHEIYDQGEFALDNVPPTRVLPDHVYVLGDNRDLSADSRVDRTQSGVEQLAISDILGRALYYTYGPSHRMGERINPE